MIGTELSFDGGFQTSPDFSIRRQRLTYPFRNRLMAWLTAS